MKKINIVMTLFLLLGVFSPLATYASENFSEDNVQNPVAMETGPLLLSLKNDSINLFVGEEFNPDDYVDLAMNNEGQVTLGDNKGLTLLSDVDMMSTGIYTAKYRLEDTSDTSQYVEKTLTVYVEDILELDYTQKANNGKVSVAFGQPFDPADYVVAKKNGTEVTLTELGFDQNGKFLGFTVEGDVVNPSKVGSYELVYILRGGSPGYEQEVVKSLTVQVEDDLKMEITDPIVLYLGQSFDPSDYAKAWRNGVEVGFGNFGPNGEYWGFIDNGDNIDLNTPGNYWITYRLHGTRSDYFLDRTVAVRIIMPKVTVKYVDEEGNSLAPAQILEGRVGEAYTAEKLTFGDYSYKNVTGNPMSYFIAGDQTITYTYSKNVVPEKGKVIVEYKDENGNALMPQQILTGEVGQSYKTEKLTIFGYTFAKTLGNSEGTFRGSEQVVTYIYSKNSTLSSANTNVTSTGKGMIGNQRSLSNNSSSNQKNTTKKSLPKMGEASAAATSFLGASLVLGIIIFYKRYKARKGNSYR